MLYSDSTQRDLYVQRNIKRNYIWGWEHRLIWGQGMGRNLWRDASPWICTPAVFNSESSKLHPASPGFDSKSCHLRCLGRGRHRRKMRRKLGR